MASKGTHIVVGIGAGLLSYGIYKRLKQEDWTLEGALGSAAAGAALACLPDVIEPALSPNHRGLAHSFALLGMLLATLKHVSDTPDLPPGLKVAISVAIGAYSSHLGVDAFSPKGLPLLS